ncbi:aminoglycoside phosphotransferase family protein [Agrococcus terreus]|uniref:phosphotransferase n=1 Tax=Agrococcus terreus TaxID=574649 RepID=UPI00384A5910
METIDAAGAPAARTASPEERLLRDALGDALEGELRVLSREPYGAGALTGFEEAGAQTRYWYVDTSGRPVPEESGLVLGDPAAPEARIWLHPADPRLPALAAASFPDAAAALLARLGVAVDQAPELLVYRPGKRAMLRMRAGERETYLKVVRPEAAATIVDLQEALRGGGIPVPAITGWSALGIVLTEAAAGEPVTGRLDAVDPARLLDSVEALQAAMGRVDTGRAARDSLALRDGWYRERLRAALDGVPGGEAAAARAALAALEAGIDAADPAALEVPAAELRTVHGDLHVGQLFVDGASAVTGLIDVDTAGLGDPVDDRAALLGHLVASIGLADDPGRARGYRRILDEAAGRWLGPAGPEAGAAESAEPARLAHRLAVHVLAHALAPVERGDLRVAAAQLGLGAAVLGLRPTAAADREEPHGHAA